MGEKPEWDFKNSIAYPFGLAVGAYAGFNLVAGLSEAWDGWPLQAAGLITVGYSCAYAAMPIIYDFGPAVKRLERRGRKVFLSAQGERTITVGNAMHSAPLFRLPKRKMALAINGPSEVIATRDVTFTHNGRKISGRLYDKWLQVGYEKQLKFQAEGKRNSGLSRAERGQLSQPLWSKLRDLLAFTVEWYVSNRGILLADSINGGFLLRCKPSVVYDCTCAILT